MRAAEPKRNTAPPKRFVKKTASTPSTFTAALEGCSKGRRRRFRASCPRRRMEHDEQTPWIAVAVAVLIAAAGAAVIATSERVERKRLGPRRRNRLHVADRAAARRRERRQQVRGRPRQRFRRRGLRRPRRRARVGRDLPRRRRADALLRARVREDPGADRGGASGKSEDGLVAAMVDAQRQQLDAAVAAGSLTQAQADQIGAQLKERVTAMVEGSFGGGRGGFGGPPGAGGFGPPGSTERGARWVRRQRRHGTAAPAPSAARRRPRRRRPPARRCNRAAVRVEPGESPGSTSFALPLAAADSQRSPSAR